MLEVLRKRTPCAEDEHLDRAFRQTGLGRDLAVRETLPLAQQDDRAVSLRHPLERFRQLRRLAGGVLGGGDDVLQRVEVANRLDPTAPPGAVAACATDVLGNLEEPGGLE